MSVDIERVVRDTSELVSIPSTVGNEQAQLDCLEYAVQQLPDWLEVTRYTYNDQSSVVISTEDTRCPDVLLHGHVDVVEAAEDDFDPERSEDRLYGRGTGDMKAGVACLMEVLRQFDSSSEIPSVALMLVTDEEAGGYDGVQHLVNEIGYEPGFAISAEPNNTGKTLPIVTRQKGIIGLRIYAEGESCHAAEPWEGRNAAHELFERQSEVLSLFEEPNPEEWRTTGVVTKLDATGYANVVPEEASMLVNVRYTTEYLPSAIERDLESMGIDFEFEYVEPQLHTRENHQMIQKLQDAITGTVPAGGECIRKAPASDMRFFSEHDIPCVVFGPDGYNAHSQEEYADISSFQPYIDSLTTFVRGAG